MNRKIEPTMKWSEAGDVITPNILGKILGCSEEYAKKYYKMQDFPKLPNEDFKSDKMAVRLYFMGIKIKDKPQNALLNLIFLELQKINMKIGDTNENEME